MTSKHDSRTAREIALRGPNAHIGAFDNDNGTRSIPAGTVVTVRAHRSEPGKGLSYAAQRVTLVDPCETYGWDVIDCTAEDGSELSVYSFSVES